MSAAEQRETVASNASSSAPIRGVPAPAALGTAFAAFTEQLDGKVGVAVTAVASAPHPPMMLGEWSVGPAWSTIKVPLVLAALRQTSPPTLTLDMIKTIRSSDNGAAEAIWVSLGDPAQAAAKVQAIMSAVGDNTVVQSKVTAPGFSAFGQTMWPLANQAHFIAAAACDGRNAVVLELMSQIIGEQKWGLGTVAGARFKGGWGPTNDRYLVRQFGTVPKSSGSAAVAIAAKPASGGFADGVVMLDRLADWISSRIHQLAS